jgi:flagellar basal body-associated protein FliL
MTRPGLSRGLFGFFLGLVLGIALISIIRLVMGLDYSASSAIFFGGFGCLFGWLWGVGSFAPQSHDHHGIDHLRENPPPDPLVGVIKTARKATPGLIESVKPLIRPMLVAFGVAIVVLVIFMLLGGSGLFTRVQTENPAAAATNLTGSVPISPDTQMSKLGIFAIVVVVVLGLLGGLAVVLALGMNKLSAQVQEAKKMPADPPKEEPLLFRLIDFFVSWVGDILDSTRRSVQR